MANDETSFESLIKELPDANSQSEVKSTATDLLARLGYGKQWHTFDCDCCYGVKLDPLEDPYIIFNIDYSKQQYPEEVEKTGFGASMMCGNKQRGYYEKGMEEIRETRSCKFVIHLTNYIFAVYDEEHLDVVEPTRDFDSEQLEKLFDPLRNPYQIPETERPDISAWEGQNQARLTDSDWEDP